MHLFACGRLEDAVGRLLLKSSASVVVVVVVVVGERG